MKLQPGLAAGAEPRRAELMRYIGITLGSALFALAMTLFLIRYQIAPGGVSGLAIVGRHLTGWPVGLLMLALNVPIFLLGVRFLGTGYGLKSLYGTVMISLFTDLFTDVLQLSLPIENEILAPVFGGVTLGMGLGLIVRSGGNTSGSGTIAQIVSTFTNLKQGVAIFIMNAGIIGAAGAVFRSADLALFGLISLYISGRIVDLVLEGMDYARAVYIISGRSGEVAELVMSRMRRGATLLKGQGAYTREPIDIVMCVVTRKELPELVGLVRAVDGRAFVIISTVHEVLGEGFRARI